MLVKTRQRRGLMVSFETRRQGLLVSLWESSMGEGREPGDHTPETISDSSTKGNKGQQQMSGVGTFFVAGGSQLDLFRAAWRGPLAKEAGPIHWLGGRTRPCGLVSKPEALPKSLPCGFF